ncbi:MAG: metal-dependent hydrolase [Bacillota bacterium]
MTYQTHFAGGLAAGAFLMLYTHSPTSEVLPVLLVAGLASLLPDIDHGGSLPNKLMGIGGKVISTVIAHRSATHSLLAAAGLVLGLLAFNVSGVYVWAAAAGLLSHLILDSLNPQGVPWIWPVKIKVSIPLVTTGHLVERYLIMPACYMIAVFFIARYFGIS